jgi:hypothetical protein
MSFSRDRLGPWWLALALVLTLAAFVFENRLRPARAQRSLATGSAEWIWSQAEPGDGWTAFYAIEDFPVAEVPLAAELVIGADEEYTVFLNGEVVGVGRWRPNEPLDRYPVERLLVAGENRLLVKLSSSRGVGGFIARLAAGGEDYAVTDSSWQLVDWYREHLKWPGTPIEAPRAPRVWGTPPTGRWGRLGGVRDRRLLPDQLAARRPLWPARVRTGPAESALAAVQADGWLAGPPERLFERPLGSWLTFDFGREVTGFLSVLPAERAGLHGYLWTGSAAPPTPRSEPPQGRLHVLVGEGAWTDVAVRRFRYATIVADADLLAANVFIVDPEIAARLLADGAETSRVLGLDLDPPRLRPSVEDEFWRQIERRERAGVGE